MNVSTIASRMTKIARTAAEEDNDPLAAHYGVTAIAAHCAYQEMLDRQIDLLAEMYLAGVTPEWYEREVEARVSGKFLYYNRHLLFEDAAKDRWAETMRQMLRRAVEQFVYGAA